jgi:hypothetical protein
MYQDACLISIKIDSGNLPMKNTRYPNAMILDPEAIKSCDELLLVCRKKQL